MPLSGIRDYFSKRIAHDVRVYGTEDFSLAAPHVFSSRRTVGTRPFAVQLNIQPPKVSSMRGHDGRRCRVNGFTFEEAHVKVRGERVRRFGRSALKAHNVPVRLNAERIKPRNGLELMLGLPQERANRIRWVSLDFRPGESVLAWYGPIVEEAVVKLALNRGHGTLLVWYNPKSRQFKTGGISVCRRLGAAEKPELRWDRDV